jgi:putative ABC transport system permease protein
LHASAALILKGSPDPLKVALLGVEPGHTGEPLIVAGRQLGTDLSEEVIIDRNTALRGKLALGDTLTVRVTQGTRDEFFDLK